MRPAWFIGMLAFAGCGRMGFEDVATSGRGDAMSVDDSARDASPDAMITPGAKSFGVTQVGASTQNTSTNRVWLSTFDLVEAGTLQRLVAYMGVGGGQPVNVRGVVYADASGTPAALIAQGTTVTLPGQAPASWVSLPFAPFASLAPGTYWLGIHNETAAQIAYEIGIGFSKNTGDLFSDGPDATYAGGQQTFTMQMSLFGEYVP